MGPELVIEIKIPGNQAKNKGDTDGKPVF